MDALLLYLFGGLSSVVIIALIVWTVIWWLFKGPDKKP